MKVKRIKWTADGVAFVVERTEGLDEEIPAAHTDVRSNGRDFNVEAILMHNENIVTDIAMEIRGKETKVRKESQRETNEVERQVFQRFLERKRDKDERDRKDKGEGKDKGNVKVKLGEIQSGATSEGMDEQVVAEHPVRITVPSVGVVSLEVDVENGTSLLEWEDGRIDEVIVLEMNRHAGGSWIRVVRKGENDRVICIGQSGEMPPVFYIVHEEVVIPQEIFIPEEISPETPREEVTS